MFTTTCENFIAIECTVCAPTQDKQRNIHFYIYIENKEIAINFDIPQFNDLFKLMDADNGSEMEKSSIQSSLQSVMME